MSIKKIFYILPFISKANIKIYYYIKKQVYVNIIKDFWHIKYFLMLLKTYSIQNYCLLHKEYVTT